MKVLNTEIDGILIIEPDIFSDNRGFFMETWNENRYLDIGISCKFKQDNLSFSQKGVLRGLHFQQPNYQAKLVSVLFGEVFDVAVDLRKNSKTFAKWTSVYLSSENKKQFFIPEGFAHGFLVMSDEALFSYKCSEVYTSANEKTIIWNDKDIAIKWPIINEQLTISIKDLSGQKLIDLSNDLT